ncbi:hypothetical protein [Sinobaca sp. H24]|uniref:hypothetical protein n=1 Tax=Sinobaca sp. H24 TaxID=2923376 RepID=UPI002079A2EE|nr:hypothetical protein [Sinobaca sp. H24]
MKYIGLFIVYTLGIGIVAALFRIMLNFIAGDPIFQNAVPAVVNGALLGSLGAIITIVWGANKQKKRSR